MTASTRTTLNRLEVDPETDALGRLALTLATILDSDPGNPAAVAKELRLTLLGLEESHGGDPDSLALLLAELSAPVEHAEN